MLSSQIDALVKHCLNADYTELLVSFSASDFWRNISHLKIIIDSVSTRMFVNLLSINLKFRDILYPARYWLSGSYPVSGSYYSVI